jgi:hypothetical protein
MRICFFLAATSCLLANSPSLLFTLHCSLFTPVFHLCPKALDEGVWKTVIEDVRCGLHEHYEDALETGNSTMPAAFPRIAVEEPR